MVKRKTRSLKNHLNDIVKKLYKMMKEEELLELDWKEKYFKINIRRKGASSAGFVPSNLDKSEKPEEKNNLNYIRSPMNGVFYLSPTPSAVPFVKENDEITPGATICILEAMKLMNEVQVERHCKIIKILVENGAAVKVNQPLFEVENL